MTTNKKKISIHINACKYNLKYDRSSYHFAEVGAFKWQVQTIYKNLWRSSSMKNSTSFTAIVFWFYPVRRDLSEPIPNIVSLKLHDCLRT